MKKILFPLLLLATVFSASAQIDFEGGYYKDALRKAKNEGKIIFIDAYTSWCGPCKWMSRNVFSNYRVGNYFNDNFINLKVDMESRLGKILARRYGINSYPTLLFIDGDGNRVYSSVGSMDSYDFINLGKKVNRKSRR